MDPIIVVDFSWADAFSQLDDHLELKVCLGLLLIVSMIVGTFLHGGMIVFERFEGDPRKRGLLNQLSSTMSFLMLTCYWIQVPIIFYFLLLGPLTISSIYWIWYMTMSVFFYGILILASEYFLTKYLTVVILKSMLPILDDFFARFLLFSTIGQAFFLAMIGSFSSEAFQFQTGLGRRPLVYIPVTPIGPE